MGRFAPGRWWRDPDLIRQFDLSTDQQRKIDAAYQQSRIRLIDLSATLQKEQAQLEPLLDAEHLDETRIVAQIDRVAEARAELEKANSRMLLSIRATLSQAQWRRLQASGRSHEGH